MLPAFLKLLHPTPPLQILSHRILWSLLLMLAIVTAMRRWPAVRAAFASRRTAALLTASAALIAVNWLLYIGAVAQGRVLEASLGYFITPLVNVALGMAVLGERLGRLQIAAIGAAAIGVAVLAATGGGAVWISVLLALTFGSYGLVRKIAGVESLVGLTIETGLLAPLAAVVLVMAEAHGTATFGADTRLTVLLVLAGAVTATPLLMFGAAARRLRYSTLGLLQFIAPTIQFLLGAFVYGEPLRAAQLAGFGFIWGGCVLFAAAAWGEGRTAVTIPD